MEIKELRKAVNIGNITAMFFRKSDAKEFSEKKGVGWRIKKIDIVGTDFFAVVNEYGVDEL